jgi:hypothetical protein
MGGFVVAVAGAGVARERVRGVVMVDGGLPFPVIPGADEQATLAALLGPALDRLALTFPDLAAVRAFWAEHPAVGPWIDVPSVAAYLARDVVPTEGGLRSACVPDAVTTDGGDFLSNAAVLDATAHLPVPATLLWATRGLLDQVPGLYDDERLAAMGRSGVTAREVLDSNHYSILWAEQGVAAISEAVRAAALGLPPTGARPSLGSTAARCHDRVTPGVVGPGSAPARGRRSGAAVGDRQWRNRTGRARAPRTARRRRPPTCSTGCRRPSCCSTASGESPSPTRSPCGCSSGRAPNCWGAPCGRSSRS